MSETKDELLPCPNPECRNTGPQDYYDDYYDHVSVVCTACGVEGQFVEIEDDNDEAEKDAARVEARRLWNLLPRALVYTSDPPKVPGRWWVKSPDEAEPVVRRVYQEDIDDGWLSGPAHQGYRFAGPIPEPVEPKGGER